MSLLDCSSCWLVCICVYNVALVTYVESMLGCIVSEKMESMGYSRKDVEEALLENKYNDVMATYLLLGRKVTEVCLCCFLCTSYKLISYSSKICRHLLLLLLLQSFYDPLSGTTRVSRYQKDE